MYKIGEAAKLMRLSTEALRYYERKGIIKPHKSVDSKYRYFDARQINHMLNMQKYQKFGFSLYEVAEMFQNCDDDEFQEFMVKKQKELMHKNLALSLRIHSIHLSLEHMQLARLAEKQPIIGKRPAMYRISYMNNKEIISSKELDQELEKWSICSDLQFLSGFMSIKNFKEKVDFHEYGFAMLKDTAEFMDVAANDIVQYFDECPAVLYCFESTSNNTIFDYTDVISKYMKEQQMSVAGDILSQILYSKYENDTFKMRHLLWIPYQ